MIESGVVERSSRLHKRKPGPFFTNSHEQVSSRVFFHSLIAQVADNTPLLTTSNGDGSSGRRQLAGVMLPPLASDEVQGPEFSHVDRLDSYRLAGAYNLRYNVSRNGANVHIYV